MAFKKKVPLFEWIHKKKDGEIFPCEVLLSTINLGYTLAVHALIRDISDRKQAILEIKKNEEKFRKLAEISPSAISIQRNNKYFFVNDACSEITGYELQEINQLGPYDIIHPEMIDFISEISNKKLKNEGDKFRYDLKILTKDKLVKWLDVSITTIKYEDQDATFAVSNDITELRGMQQSIQKSEEKYRSLIENLRQEYFFYRHNKEGIFNYISPSIKNILGYDQTDFLTHYEKYLTNNPINKAAIEKTLLALEGIQQLPYEIEIYDIQRNKHILEISEAPIVDSYGNVQYVEGIAHDVTTKKKAEKIIKDQLEEIKINNEEIKSINEELHAVNDDLELRIKEIDILNKELSFSKSKYETLVKNIPGIVFRYRIDKKWTMEYISDEVEVLTGYKANDFILSNTRTFDSLIHIDDKKKVHDVINKNIEKNQSYSVEYRLVDLKGKVLWVYERGQFFNKGKKKLVNGVVLDISDKKKVEEKLIKSERELRKLNAQKDKFFSIIAHDLRSPVSNFVQVSELLKLSYEEIPQEKIKLLFSDMNLLANSTFKLLDNLLIWSRSQLGHLDIKKEKINLYNIVEDIRNLYIENIKNKDLRLINDLQENFYVRSDSNIAHTVIRNLINNAIKFTVSGGEIVISSSSQKKLLNKYIISIKDNGIGIPGDKINKILDIDDDYTTLGTEKEKGTGIGLVLCKELIEKTGDKIWVESEVGKGTSFYFTLDR